MIPSIFYVALIVFSTSTITITHDVGFPTYDGRFLRGHVILVEFLTQVLTCGDGMCNVVALSVGDLLFEHATPIALRVDLHLLVDIVRRQKADHEHIRLYAICRSGDGNPRSRMLWYVT